MIRINDRLRLHCRHKISGSIVVGVLGDRNYDDRLFIVLCEILDVMLFPRSPLSICGEV
ncbi:MAG: hypothetical protein KME32_21245 [Mojavia pulchra JT2-VF2]|uniref:Uncharacterized protein n=1 Tax=Mojavia pulchra JT2-VF2 TaxID=287848 RepID=A0A951Q003_9NOST|nr:hypothetical protein [Mojavia pulchra JT2-VF2]